MLKLERLDDAINLIERILNDANLVDLNMKRIFPITIMNFKEVKEKFHDKENYKNVMNKLNDLEQKNELNKIDLEQLALNYLYVAENKIENNKQKFKIDTNKSKQIKNETIKVKEIVKTNETNKAKQNEAKKTVAKETIKINLDTNNNKIVDKKTQATSQLNSLYNESNLNKFVELFDKTYLNNSDIIPIQTLTQYTFCLLSIVSSLLKQIRKLIFNYLLKNIKEYKRVI
jgi:hypothetical protein